MDYKEADFYAYPVDEEIISARVLSNEIAV